MWQLSAHLSNIFPIFVPLSLKIMFFVSLFVQTYRKFFFQLSKLGQKGFICRKVCHEFRIATISNKGQILGT